MPRRIVTAREQVEMLSPWRAAAVEPPSLPVLKDDFTDWWHDSVNNPEHFTAEHGLQRWPHIEQYLADHHHLTPHDDPEGFYNHPTTVQMQKLHALAQGSTWPDGWDQPLNEDPLELAALGLSKLKLRQHQRSTQASYSRSMEKMAMQPVTVYTKPSCVQCDMTKKRLDHYGIPHEVIDLTQDPDAYHHVTQNLGYSSAPVVVAGDDHWGGFKEDRIRGLAG